MTILLFDVDGVLIQGYHAKAECRVCWDERLEEDFGIPRAVFTGQFIRTVFKQEVLTGKTGLYSALKAALPELGYRGDPQAVIDYWIEQDSKVNDPLLRHVEQLARIPDVTLFLASNQEHVRAKYLMGNVGFSKYFADIFYSARLGYLKPDRRFFEEVERLLPREDDTSVVLFDDDQAAVDAAKDFGWEAHQFDGPEDIFKSDTIKALLSGAT